jgi:hypothetical protein
MKPWVQTTVPQKKKKKKKEILKVSITTEDISICQRTTTPPCPIAELTSCSLSFNSADLYEVMSSLLYMQTRNTGTHSEGPSHCLNHLVKCGTQWHSLTFPEKGPENWVLTCPWGTSCDQPVVDPFGPLPLQVWSKTQQHQHYMEHMRSEKN